MCVSVYVCVYLYEQLENGVSHRESKKSIPYTNDLSGHIESSLHAAEDNFSTMTTHNG